MAKRTIRIERTFNTGRLDPPPPQKSEAETAFAFVGIAVLVVFTIGGLIAALVGLAQ